MVTADIGYEASNPNANRVNGLFGQVNLLSDRATEVSFCFEDPSTGSLVTVPEVAFFFHDFDGSPSEKERLQVLPKARVHRPGASSTLDLTRACPGQVSNFSSYMTSQELNGIPTQLEVTELDDGRMQFVSTEAGTGTDNAQDPYQLTDLQRSRMVMVCPPCIASLPTMDALCRPARAQPTHTVPAPHTITTPCAQRWPVLMATPPITR